MRYQNTKTGAIIEVASVISGENWEPMEVEKKTPAKKKGTRKVSEK